MTSRSGLRPSRRWLAAAGLSAVAFIGGTVAQALPASPAGQWSGGSVRLSSAYSTDSVSISGTSGPESLKRVIRSSVVVPSGRVADVQATFTATLLPNNGSGTYAYCFGRFTIDSQSNTDPAFHPGQVQLIGGPHANQPNAISVAMGGFRRNLGPGTHFVNVYVSSAYEGCQLQERSLNLVINVR